MKFKSLLTVIGTLALWAMLTSTLRNPNNPPLGNTGAPSETTCAKAGCHINAGTLTGSVSLSGLPDTVRPSQTYQITLTHTSNAVKAGFQLTCLDASNAKCGNLTAGTGSNTGNFSSRQYIRQSTPKFLSGGSTSWTFSWTAPATLAADSLRFYFVSLASNNNGNNSGDNVLKSSKKVIFSATSASHEPDDASLVRMYPNPAVQLVQVELATSAPAQLTLYDASGKAVLDTALLQASNRLDVSTLPRGTYLAKIRIGQRLVTRQLVVGK